MTYHSDLRKAAEMALELLEIHVEDPRCEVSICKTVATLRQALAQSKDQGVITYRTGYESGYMDASVALKREWVGLTDDDYMYKDHRVEFYLGAMWAEAKLKEKNT